jgi:hypothetical protein
LAQESSLDHYPRSLPITSLELHNTLFILILIFPPPNRNFVNAYQRYMG